MIRTPTIDGRRQVRLSPGEQELLKLIVQGLGAKEIAAKLKRSVPGVQNRIQLLCRGLGVSGLRQCMLWGITHLGAEQGHWVEDRPLELRWWPQEDLPKAA